MSRLERIALSALPLAFALLTACSGAGDSASAAPSDGSSGGPPDYGDPPAESTMSLDGMQRMLDFCVVEQGTTLTWTDPSGEARGACLINAAGATKDKPLPLLVYLHPSLVDADKSLMLTGFLADAASADLSGDPARAGFVLLMPAGRDTTHYYPAPDDTGLGWDNWYRNFDRTSPTLNVDVAAIDHFIAAVKDTGIVDPDRVYLSGWSNGAAMAQIYALNSPGIAAAAVYSSPNPFSDVKDPHAQAPFATNLTPLMDIHNQCDIVGICVTGTKFHTDLAATYPSLIQRPVVIDETLQEVAACDTSAMCTSQDVQSSSPIGASNHLRWPINWNTQMYEFFRAHPLH